MAPRRRTFLARATLLFAALAAPGAALAATVTVFAAASLKGPLDEVARAFEAASGHRARIAYAASSALARQIEAGAPAGIFLSADLQWMAWVQERGLLQRPSAPLLAGALVLVARSGDRAALRIAPGFPLVDALAGGRLAMGDPRSVPAGRYARAALESLGVWKEVRGRIAAAENVRAALALVVRGEAPLGIVYRTDALAEPAVRIVDAFPPHSHPRIVYPLGVLRGAPPAAHELAAFLASPGARAIWRRHGFEAP